MSHLDLRYPMRQRLINPLRPNSAFKPGHSCLNDSCTASAPIRLAINQEKTSLWPLRHCRGIQTNRRKNKQIRKMNTAFVSSPLPVRLTTSSPAVVALSSRPRRCVTRSRVTMMSDEDVSPAERTRRLLAESESRVKYRRGISEPETTESEFRYTSGTTSGGFDIWLVAALLTVIVPAVGFAVGVATGNIDVSPR